MSIKLILADYLKKILYSYTTKGIIKLFYIYFNGLNIMAIGSLLACMWTGDKKGVQGFILILTLRQEKLLIFSIQDF